MRVRTPFRCSPHPCEYEIAFVSDVEGDLDYFNRWVAGSRCVAYTGSDEAALTLTHARAYFVYGGDVPDHGRGSEQLLRLLVGLKRAFPRRVALLVGNRDLNKLRLTSECAPSDLARPHWSIPAPHWDPSAPTLAASRAGCSGARRRRDGSVLRLCRRAAALDVREHARLPGNVRGAASRARGLAKRRKRHRRQRRRRRRRRRGRCGER